LGNGVRREGGEGTTVVKRRKSQVRRHSGSRALIQRDQGPTKGGRRESSRACRGEIKKKGGNFCSGDKQNHLVERFGVGNEERYNVKQEMGRRKESGSTVTSCWLRMKKKCEAL